MSAFHSISLKTISLISISMPLHLHHCLQILTFVSNYFQKLIIPNENSGADYGNFAIWIKSIF
jgi:hypothetical protein